MLHIIHEKLFNIPMILLYGIRKHQTFYRVILFFKDSLFKIFKILNYLFILLYLFL